MGLRAWPALALGALLACGDDPNQLRGGGRGAGDDDDDWSGGNAEIIAAGGSSANEACFNTINEYRKKDGLKPYARWTDSETCADGQAKSDSSTGNGHGSFGRCGEMAQNECPGTAGGVDKALPRCLSMMWAEGPGGGHHDSMASTKYTKVACGVFVTSRGATWSVQNFR